MDKARLSLLTFPQRWDGQCLRASVLVLPRGDPLHAPLWDQGAAFAGMPLTLQLELQSGGEVFSPGRRGNRSVVFTPPPAARSRELFGALHDRFDLAQPAVRVARGRQPARHHDRQLCAAATLAAAAAEMGWEMTT